MPVSSVKYNLPITQTSCMVAVVSTLLVAVAFTSNVDPVETSWLGNVLKLIHLGTFSTWFGIQIWVTFIAGLTMYRNLPRHTFGFIQGKLFPKYFLLGTVLSSVTLTSFVILNPLASWKQQQTIQGSALFIGLSMAFSCMLYFEPQTSKCTMAKHKFEKEMSAGQAVGKVEEDKLKELRKIEEYVILEKRFIALHTYSTLANLISLVVQTVHLWYLSCHLSAV